MKEVFLNPNAINTFIQILYTLLILQQFDYYELAATMESAFIKLYTLIWTSNPYASIVQHADMIAFHSKNVCKNKTAHQRHLSAERIILNAQDNTVYSISQKSEDLYTFLFNKGHADASDVNGSTYFKYPEWTHGLTNHQRKKNAGKLFEEGLTFQTGTTTFRETFQKKNCSVIKIF